MPFLHKAYILQGSWAKEKYMGCQEVIEAMKKNKTGAGKAVLE
jgi:hypothetical protein